MVDSAKFFNVKINVDGETHIVKVEQGITFNSCFALGDNQIVKYNKEKFYENDTHEYGEKIRLEYTSEIKMSKEEFTIFKNMADNYKEEGNEIFLSRIDIYEAEAFFNDSLFTDDISKNIRAEVDHSKQNVYTKDRATTIEINIGGDEKSMIYSDKEIYSDYVKDLAKKSASGEVKALWNSNKGVEGYKYIDKDGKLHKVGNPDKTDWEDIVYEQDGKHIEESYEKGVLTYKKENYKENDIYIESFYKKGVLQNISKTYKQGDKNIKELDGVDGYTKYVMYTNKEGQSVEELYDKNNQILKRDIENGKIIEGYENNTLVFKKVNNNKFYYKDSELDSSRQYVRAGGNKLLICEFDGENRIISCQEFNVIAIAEQKLSNNAQVYNDKFKTMSPKEIANKIKNQIDGPSMRSKTLAMLEGIPADKFVQVLKEYKKIGGIWFGNKASLYTDLQNEWRIEPEEVYNLIRKAVASYLRTKTADTLTPDDMVLIEKIKNKWNKPNLDGVSLQSILETEEQQKEYFAKIEDYITK